MAPHVGPPLYNRAVAYSIVFGITSGYVLMHYHFNWPLFSAERLLMTTIICNIVFTIILWGLAYLRFKESDVIDRLF